jgi:hypothetical protein
MDWLDKASEQLFPHRAADSTFVDSNTRRRLLDGPIEHRAEDLRPSE